MKTISPHGLTLAGTIATEPGKVLTLVVTLPDGEAYLSGTVMWVRESVNQCGLRLISLDSVTESRLERVVNELSATPNEPVPQTGYTVLIADDDSSILDFLARLAIKAGHRVVRAERGDRALELVRQETPQLVFLDILMPGLDGLEVARAIRNDAALSGIPVVLLSAMGEARLSEAARNAGAADFLTKPVRVESVRSILTKYLPAAGKPALR